MRRISKRKKVGHQLALSLHSYLGLTKSFCGAATSCPMATVLQSQPASSSSQRLAASA